MSKLVADIVVAAHQAAAEAIARHYAELLSAGVHRGSYEDLAAALDHGYEADLQDYVAKDQPVGFDHGAISDVFRRRLRVQDLQKRRLSRHIWEADESRGLYSLAGRPPGAAEQLRNRRTRASSIVQRAMRDCRSFRQAEKATTADPSAYVTIPSPLFIAARLLRDARSSGSGAYAEAALQEWTREALENHTGEPADISFAAISEALDVIKNRWRTSKPIKSDCQRNGPTVLFLCNLFAIHGLMAMRVDLPALVQMASWLPAKVGAEAPMDFDRLFSELLIGGRGAEEVAEFLVNPHFVELLSPGAVLNLLEGMPIPIEGGSTVFQGGIRLSDEGSIVGAVSGSFGAGKTLFCVSLAAALAPLGCRTLFLSCEESANDIEARLLEAAPRSLFRSEPLFRCLDRSDFQIRKSGISKDDGHEGGFPWFVARQISLNAPAAPNAVPIDPALALSNLLEDALSHADFFKPFRRENEASTWPRFARPVIIVDGLHQLFDLPDAPRVAEASLRSLIDRCRELGAVFLFSFSAEAVELKRLEYLCDLMIELEREGFQKPSDKPRRYFQLLKARRQPARIGAHVFHLKGEAGFRIKPSVDARVQEAKKELWWDPDPRGEIFLTEDPPLGFRGSSRESRSQNTLAIQNRGQVLVIGKGSSGKAGFGLYVLHRRWFDRRMFAAEGALGQFSLLDQDQEEVARLERMSMRRQAIAKAGLPVGHEAAYLETRVLVVSFLYQKSYYDDLTIRLASRRRGKAVRSAAQFGPVTSLTGLEFTPVPDRMRTDTLEFYPGQLSVEDFLARVDKALQAAEDLGLPYTGVLIDGLHNVFVQFPALERESAFWGVFYNILRRRRVTVVTTHTEFDIKGGVSRTKSQGDTHPTMLMYDFDQAQRKIAPLLSALVSGADYLFELSATSDGYAAGYQVTPRGSISYDISGATYTWDKERLRLQESTEIRPTPTSRQPRAASKGAAGERLMEALAGAMKELAQRSL